MSASEAADVLVEFKKRGEEGLQHLEVDRSYSLSTLPRYLEKVARNLKRIPVDEDPNVPAFIKETDDYKAGLFEFTPDSKQAIIVAAYYLGECFVRAFPHLNWAVGNLDYASGNMPVVTGFGNGKELPVLMVLENLFARRMENPEINGVFSTAIDRWQKNAS
jgi:hypothetical protein